METDTHTDTQNDYRNPRCACAPRVNNDTLYTVIVRGFAPAGEGESTGDVRR